MSGDVVIVTGAGRGIGAAIARELARKKMRVIVNYRSDRASAEAVVASIVADGGTARAVAADVTEPAEIAELIDETVNTYGSLAAIVCNANTVSPTFESIADLDWNDFQSKVIGELAGAFHLTQQALPHLRQHSSGSIVFISSTAADYVGPGRIAHGTAKAALTTFAGHIASYAVPFGIVVTTIAPGVVRTEATASLLTPERVRSAAATSGLGRVAEPEDVARLVSLALDPAMAIAPGMVLRADGGHRLIAGGPIAAR